MFNLYAVESGPNNSHLFEVKVFNRLKDAREYIDNLPVTPTGQDRPYKLNRLSYSDRKALYHECSNVIDERLM